MAPPALPPPPRDYIQRARTAQGLTAGTRSVARATADAIATVGARARGSAPGAVVRAYEVWPTKNVFCCWGYLMTGPIEDIGPNTCAWTSLLAPMAIFFFVWGDVLWNSNELPPVRAGLPSPQLPSPSLRLASPLVLGLISSASTPSSNALAPTLDCPYSVLALPIPSAGLRLRLLCRLRVGHILVCGDVLHGPWHHPARP